jgi:hypothetical protein
MGRVLGGLTALLVVWGCVPGRPPGGDGGTDTSDDNNNVRRVATCDVSGVEIVIPDVDASLVGGGAPDLSCIGNPRVVGASTPVTVEGCIDVFGVGNDAKSGTEIAVFPADADPTTARPIATGVVAVRNQASGLECEGADENDPACRALDCGSKGFYRLTATVPTHEPLIMAVRHPTDSTVIDTYLYGHVFFNDDAVDGVVNYEAPMIFRSTWDSIPTLSGRQITGGQDVTDGQGRAVIAGEIHDCNDRIITGAAVSIPALDSTMRVAYFDGNTDDPKPDLRRVTTAEDGLYVLLNVPTDPGQNEHVVTAGIRDAGCTGDDCTCQSAGSRTVRVFPDSVTITTLRGDLPVVR